MTNETAHKHLTEMYGQTFAGVKLLLPRMNAKGLGRVLEIYSGLPFVKPVKSPATQDELVLLQGLIKLGDLRSSILELVNEDGKVKPNEEDTSEAVITVADGNQSTSADGAGTAST